MDHKLIYFLFGIYLFMEQFSSSQTEYCYMKEEKPYHYFAATTAYDLIRPKEMKILAGCTPVYIWALIRHGTRFTKKKFSYKAKEITIIKNQIIENHEAKKGKLCDEDLDSLKKWTYKWDENMDGELAPQGKKDIASLAKRLKQYFNQLMPNDKNKYVFRTSSTPRCKDSALAFTNEIFGTQYSMLDANNIVENDTLLKFENHDSSKVHVESMKFIMSQYAQTLTSEVSKRLGFENTLALEVIKQLYAMCSYEIAWNPENKASFCAAFTPDHLKLLEYDADLEYYYLDGYGDPKNAQAASVLVNDLLKKLNDASKKEPSQVATVYFGHSETILPFITKLNVYSETEPLQSNNYESKKNDRKWRTSIIDPFAANIIAVLYKCGEEHKVVFYNNENIIQLPNCEGEACLLKTLNGKFKDEFQEDAPSSSASMVQTVSTSTLIFIIQVYILQKFFISYFF